MNKRLTELMVGLAFVIGVGLLGLYTIVLSDLQFGGTRKYVVDFEQVYGLKEGDPVRVEGYKKGKVKQLRILPAGSIRAVLEVENDVTIYRDDSQVKVTPFSPLGGRVIEIKRGRPSPRGECVYFDAEGGKSLDDLDPEEDVIAGVAEGELLQTLNQLVEDNRKSVGRIVSNLEKVSKALTHSDSALGYLINSDDGGKRLKEVADGMSSSAQRLDRILARVERGDGVVGGLLLEGSQLDEDVTAAASAGRSALEDVSRITRRADEGKSALGVLVSEDAEVAGAAEGIVTDVKAITGKVASGSGSLGKLVYDDRLYDGAASTVKNLESITNKVDSGKGLLGVLLEEEAGKNTRKTLENLAGITEAVNDPKAGTIGLLIHDDRLRRRVARIARDVENLVVEFRDSLEDVREQAPVNAFIGAVFSAF